MKIIRGEKKGKINSKNLTSILDIFFDNKYAIYIFQGRLSKNDIIIKYSENKKRIRTPKHVHWAVDLLLKLQKEKELTKLFIADMLKKWESFKPLEDNDYDTLKSFLYENMKMSDVSKYKKLNNYGEYSVDFLIILMNLLMLQEKTNNPEAYMFKNVLNALLQDELDIFAIISAASFRGRF